MDLLFTQACNTRHLPASLNIARLGQADIPGAAFDKAIGVMEDARPPVDIDFVLDRRGDLPNQ